MNAKIEDFGKQLRDVLDAADKLLDAGVDQASDIPEAARDGLRQAREHLGSAYEALGGKAKAVNRIVHEHPWQAVAATGLVAFLLGLLVRRR
jgi:ElaB/YqjD/DUF883 family membrane-anchored ribosome-binding protein